MQAQSGKMASSLSVMMLSCRCCPDLKISKQTHLIWGRATTNGTYFAHEKGPSTCKMIIKKGPPTVLLMQVIRIATKRNSAVHCRVPCLQMERGHYLVCPGAGITPSCCSAPRASQGADLPQSCSWRSGRW